jgi:hypothetical protein
MIGERSVKMGNIQEWDKQTANLKPSGGEQRLMANCECSSESLKSIPMLSIDSGIGFGFAL